MPSTMASAPQFQPSIWKGLPSVGALPMLLFQKALEGSGMIRCSPKCFGSPGQDRELDRFHSP